MRLLVLLLFVITLTKIRPCIGFMCHCTPRFHNNDCTGTATSCNTVCVVNAADPSNPDGGIFQSCYSGAKPTFAIRADCDNFESVVGFCCYSGDFCNSKEAYDDWRRSIQRTSTGLPITTTVAPTTLTEVATTTAVIATVNTSSVDSLPTGNVANRQEASDSDSSPPPYAIALIVVLSLIIFVVIVVIVVVLSMYLFSCCRTKKQGPVKPASSITFEAASSVVDITVSSTDWSAGSDAGAPLLGQSHISRQITKVDLIGRGRYGQVWRGYYKGEYVAVKVFQSIEEVSWQHEKDIYIKCNLRHPNILRFIAADRSDAGMFIENWLIAEFCDNGNLYDYLQCYVLAETTVVEMTNDIASGLVFIHSEITGTEGKAAIAHRDMKSRNILVKKDLSLCIGDFGLAVQHNTSNDSVEELPTRKVGTKRYLAPEILEETMNMKIFDSFKRADIYSFGLVLWEIMRRGQCNGLVEEPQLPYYDCVASDPSFEEMYNVVCVEQRRPVILNRWHRSPVYSGLAKLLNECWHHNGAARLTALRIRRRLEDILHKSADKGDNLEGSTKP